MLMKLPIIIGGRGKIDMPEMALDKEAMRRFWVARGSAWDRWADVVATPAARMM